MSSDTTSHSDLAVRGEDSYQPIPNPGLEHDGERFSDVDPARGKQVYRQVVGMLALVPLLAIAFVVIYFAVPSDLYIATFFMRANAQHVGFGLTAGSAVLLIGLALVHWGKQIMGDAEMVDHRHPARGSDAQRRDMVAALNEGIEQSGIKRRSLIGGALGGALGFVAIPAVVLLLDASPIWPTDSVRKETIEKTLWAEGVRLANAVTYKEIKASDMEIGQLVNAEPKTLEALAHDDPAAYHREKAKTALIIVRMDPNSIKIPESRKDWHVGGILAYSKICTHVGCPISLWERQTHHLLCPCHQSTFDLGDSGVVVFGPAARSLPQLPITVDADGYLVARSDFTVPVGPSYFERDSRHDFQKGDR